MALDNIGPIAPPIILIVFIRAAEVAISAFGINKIIIASRVTNSPEPTPKNIRLIVTCSEVECRIISSIKKISRITPYFSAIIPAVGPRITIA
jgi:hypothetical protein